MSHDKPLGRLHRALGPGTVRSRSARIRRTPRRPRCWATCPGRSRTRPGYVARPSAAAGSSDGPGPTRPARPRRVRRGRLGRGARPRGRRAAPGPRRARQRGDLRRLVRLGERRPVPPRAEPAAPLPQPDRRLHRRRATPTPRRVRWSCCRTSSATAERGAAQRARRGRRSLEHTELVVAFGGMPAKNVWVTPGGVTRHTAPGAPRPASPAPGAEVVLVSPLRADLPRRGRRRRGCRSLPGTDTAVMLGLAHILLTEGLHDRAFLERTHCAGSRHVLASTCWRHRQGRRRGPRRSAASPPRRSATWPGAWRRAARSSPSPGRCSAPSTASSRCGWARAGRAARPDRPARRRLRPRLRLDGRRRRAAARPCRLPRPAAGPQPGPRPTSPSPGSPTCCCTRRDVRLRRRRRCTYPDIRLVYWAGGNPFHHHQDLNRLRRALRPPGHGRRPRAVLDRDRPARRHRAAGHDDASSATTSAPAATTAT